MGLKDWLKVAGGVVVLMGTIAAVWFVIMLVGVAIHG